VPKLVYGFFNGNEALILHRHLCEDFAELRERLIEVVLALFEIAEVVPDYPDIRPHREEHRKSGAKEGDDLDNVPYGNRPIDHR
jgi:hypothetical protein